MTARWVPLKHLALLNPETLDESTPDDLGFRYIDIAATGRGRLISPPQPMTFGSAPSRARRILRSGDTILSTVRTYLRAVWTLRGDDDDLVASTGFVCLRPNDEVDPRYLGWLADSDLVVEEVVARSVGVSYPAINPSEVGTIKVPLRPLEEQRAIADHLDRETTRIDALIGAKGRMLKVLEERYWTAFMQRVAHQSSQRTPLRRILTSLIDGPFGSAFSSSDYSDEGAAVVRLGNIGFGEYRTSEQARIPMALYERFRAYAVDSGDLLIAGLGDDRNHAGRACVAPALGPAIVKGKCFRARADPSRVSAEFLALLLSSPIGSAAMSIAGRGSTRSMINLEIVKSTEVWLPTRSRQDEIVAESRADRVRTRAAQVTIRRQLQVLFERRQAMITTAVTGDLPVSVAV